MRAGRLRVRIPPCAAMADDGGAGAAGSGAGVSQGSSGTAERRRAAITSREKGRALGAHREGGEGRAGCGARSPGGSRGCPGRAAERSGAMWDPRGARRHFRVHRTGRCPRRVRKYRSLESRVHVFSPGACRELQSFVSRLPGGPAGFAVHAGRCSFAARATTACALGPSPALSGAA